MHPALTDDIGICFLSIQSVLSTVPSIPSRHLWSREYRWGKPRHGKITLCPSSHSQQVKEPTSALGQLCSAGRLLTTRRWHFFPPGCFSPRLESSSLFSSFSLITLLFKYLSPLPRTAEFPQLQHLSLLFLGLRAEMYKAVSEILSVNMF